MNTEIKKSIWRYTIYVLFWTAVIVAGVLLASPVGGTGSWGTGPGAGTHGDGTGKGSGNKGDGSGKEGSNTAKKDAQGDSPQHVSSSPVTVKKQQDNKVERAIPVKQQSPQEAPVKISVSGNVSNDIATIYIPGKSSGSSSAAGTKAGFFGVEISGSVIFLLDISGSMGSTTQDGSKTRLELVKDEIAKSLKEKYAEACRGKNKDRFRIVTFSSGCTVYPAAESRSYSFSSNEDVVKAIRYVRNLSACGGTNMALAWKTILPVITKDEIKSVHFLSDGQPGDCTEESLKRDLRNSVPTLRIHGISMGQKSSLLQNIAKQHKGIYREVY